MDDNCSNDTLFDTHLLALSLGLLLFYNHPGFNATFTSLGKSGKEGPTSLGSHYTGQDHVGKVKLSSSIQQWTVPFTGEYRIEAVGAAGGHDKKQNSTQYIGRGTRMVGTFNLSQGEMIQILVGQEGEIRSSGKIGGSGGGGGTFVVRGNNTPLIVAGGGGGVRAVTSRHEGCDAIISTSGSAGYKAWPGGSNGDGGKTGVLGHSGESSENNYFDFTKVSCCRKFLITDLSPGVS